MNKSQKNSQQKQSHAPIDIIIVGGGLVGATMAVKMSQINPALQITVVEAQIIPGPPKAKIASASNEGDASRDKPRFAQHTSYDTRGTALSYGSKKIYESMGLWEYFQDCSCPIKTVQVSDRGHIGTTRLHCEDAGVDALGYVVENKTMGPILFRKIKEAENVHWISPASVTKITPLVSGVQVHVSGEAIAPKDEIQLKAQLVLVCDGADSPMRKYLGIQIEEQDYCQHAVIANVSSTLPHENTAFERFTDLGPMGLLPLTDYEGGDHQHRSALIWTLPESMAKEVLELDDEEFMSRLHERFGSRLGKFVKVGSRYSYPLKLIKAKEQVRSRIVLMGSAAHALHPVAGQGYNLALRDMESLSRILGDAYHAGEDLGSLNILNRYREYQATDQEMIMTFSDGVVKLFSNDNKVLALGRNLGLLAMDIIPGAKSVFARYAMGMGGRIGIEAPKRLLRGKSNISTRAKSITEPKAKST